MSNTYGNPYSFGLSGGNQNNLYPNVGGNQVPSYSSVGGNQVPSYSSYGGNQVTPYGVPMNIPGRVVTSDQDIVPSEVPLDGRLILFPVSDYSCIYAKQWDRNGNGIITVKYVPEIVQEEVAEKASSVTLEQVSEQLNDIKSMLRHRQKPKNQNYKTNQNGSNYRKKDVNDA